MRRKMQWNRRPKHEQTMVGYKRTWTSRCGRYRVEEITPLGGLGRCYYALVADTGRGHLQWDFVDPQHRRHRSRQAAERACLRHWKQNGMAFLF